LPWNTLCYKDLPLREFPEQVERTPPDSVYGAPAHVEWLIGITALSNNELLSGD
jgi:hypothetical protein